MPENGALAAALAKAQSGFATVKRDKKVTVQTKTGGSYSFNYAPLDSILEAVRKPLADNGLVVVQLLDDGDLVTMLIHESGAQISGSVALPSSNEIQAFGSAITYLRRYAIQALLGIAAEDDDDGNRAVGNVARPTEQDTNLPDATDDGQEQTEFLGKLQKVGTVVRGGAAMYQAQFHPTPEGHAFGFKLKLAGDDKDIPQVLVTGSYGDALFLAYVGEAAGLIGEHVTVKGRLYNVRQPGRKSYYRLVIGEADNDVIETPKVRIPASDEPDTIPMLPLDDAEKALIGGTG